MSDDNVLPVDENEQQDPAVETPEEETVEPLKIELDVKEESACERHVTITVPEEEIARYFDKEFDELVPEAEIPGFRPGHAPRKLVEKRMRKDVAERVKSNIVVDAISQANEDADMTPISEPDFEYDSFELPEEGPMTFEFNVEVRPNFDLPDWKGLKLERPVRDFSDEDVSMAMTRYLEQDGELIDKDGDVAMGDYITTKLTFAHLGQELSSADGEVIRIRPTLSFHDGSIANFGEKLVGAKSGDVIELSTELSQDAPNAMLRGQTISATFAIEKIQELKLPELNEEYLKSIGGFDSEGDLRDAVLDVLNRQMEYEQNQVARQQLTAELLKTADWELPKGLLERQSARELQRSVLELRRSGFTEDMIRSHENLLRQNSLQSTAQSLKEHFILEKIAELQEVEPTDEDYALEISLIAEQSGLSDRRLRARLEKSGEMDSLRNQIVERKVIALILDAAEFEETVYDPDVLSESAVNRAAGGEAQEEETTEETTEEAAVEETTSDDAKEATEE